MMDLPCDWTGDNLHNDESEREKNRKLLFCTNSIDSNHNSKISSKFHSKHSELAQLDINNSISIRNLSDSLNDVSRGLVNKKKSLTSKITYLIQHSSPVGDMCIENYLKHAIVHWSMIGGSFDLMVLLLSSSPHLALAMNEWICDKIIFSLWLNALLLLAVDSSSITRDKLTLAISCDVHNFSNKIQLIKLFFDRIKNIRNCCVLKHSFIQIN